MKLLSRPEYEESLAASRDCRMKWWREARFGMFIHFGLYSVAGTHEWTMAWEGWPTAEYEKFAEGFNPSPDAARSWAKLAKAAGMKYMVLTTRHHDGFSLWDSKANPYNSMNLGPKRDIVREFVDACREYDLKIGFYSSLMDWHHPDGGAAAYDSAARKRFNDYILALNEELLTNYGKIDILWYDVPLPMESDEGWNSLERNQYLRSLQPDIIINDRSRLPEDFTTPEENMGSGIKGDWESCMTFNGISWGYVDSEQAAPYSYNAQRILKMLNHCSRNGGNLLLNIGPAPDGSVPPEAVEPLETVGKWLAVNGECVYGTMGKLASWGLNGVCSTSVKDNKFYLWNNIWPKNGTMVLGGEMSEIKNIYLLATGEKLEFTQEKYRTIVKGLPKSSPDKTANIAVIVVEFAGTPSHVGFGTTPPLNKGKVSG